MFMIINEEVVLILLWRGAIVPIQVDSTNTVNDLKNKFVVIAIVDEIQWKKRIFIEPHIAINLTTEAILSNDMQIQSN